MIRIDRDWLRAHPLPPVEADTDKNARGRVLAVGGGLKCPGALLLTGEAVLRSGAGKLQMATVREAALALGVAMPEAGVIALDTDEEGEIDGPAAVRALGKAAGYSDAVVVGPGMSDSDPALVTGLAEALDGDGAMLIDAAAIGACKDCVSVVKALNGRAVLTPHPGEMAQLTGEDAEAIAEDMEESARAAAERFGAVIVLKGPRTVIAAPGAEAL